MSRTATLNSTSLNDEYTTTAEASKLDQMAMQASGTSLDLIETGIAVIQPVTGEHPVIPAVTHGRVIMPSLGNETLKYVSVCLGRRLIVGRNWEERVGNYFILFFRDFRNSPRWMNGKR